MKKLQNRLPVIFAVLILGFAAVGGAACQKITADLCRTGAEIVDDAVELALTGDFEGAREKSDRLRRLWEEKQLYLGMFYDHESVNKIGEGIARLSVYVGEESLSSLKAEAETLKAQLEAFEKYDFVNAINLI